jgi:hypothetical protein
MVEKRQPVIVRPLRSNTGAGAAMMRVEAARRGIGLGPEHDWSSHAADAFGYMAIAYEEPAVKSAAIRRPSPPRIGMLSAFGQPNPEQLESLGAGWVAEDG